MIKQEINYIAKRKKKFLMMSFICGLVVAGFFITGLFIVKTRSNYFTLVAALFVLPLSQNMTRFISFSRFKDPDAEYGKLLEQMKGSYYLFHSAIMPDQTTTAFFEHVIVTSKSIYFLSYHEEIIQKYKIGLQSKLSAKGVALKNIHFIPISHFNSIKNTAFKIEKDACYRDEMLEQHAKLLEAMMM